MAGDSKREKIAIIGSGLIGSSWAMLFASAGYNVALYDTQPSQVEAALERIKTQLMKHEENKVLRGKLSSKQQFQLICGATSLADCVKNAKHVQECVFEDVELKKKIFHELDQLVSDDTVLCSSTSCFPPSQFTAELSHKKQAIVGHPVNPPYYVPLVELIPAPWTDPSVVERTRALMTEIGQKPVVLRKEIPGFALNRIQYTILNECWRLVEDGVMSVEDVDTVMSEGLGMRYAFMGPLETAYLNADGMVDYCRRYGTGIYRVSETFGAIPELGGEMAQRVENELAKKVPLDKIPDRRLWRDANLIALAKLKNQNS